ncbi:hypothetical protein ACP4OV_026988 [Aristida adscensionis]
MEASRRPVAKTASTCTAEAARGTHSFRIAGYSLHRGLGVGHYIRSAAFAVGGSEWCIRYYPDGALERSAGFAAVFLEHLSGLVGVTARFDLRLVHPDTGLSSSRFSSSAVFDKHRRSGTNLFDTITNLEKVFIRDDCLVLECDVTVLKEPQVEETPIAADLEGQVPPSDLGDSFGKLLESEEGADVAFKVKGELLHAHRLVLAARSPVFKAELYGPMSENKMECIVIEDMVPAVFKALLRFVYTDSLPAMDDLDEEENEEMVKHLLVAADRYAVERLKLVCETMLCKRLKVESVAATLALADQHHCDMLKDACIGFISSSDRMDNVMASKGYQHLKRACPAVFVDMWEKTAKSRRI